MLWLEELGQLKKFNDASKNRTRELSACNTMPLPCTVPSVPYFWRARIYITYVVFWDVTPCGASKKRRFVGT
jgi:hypothetical protein